MPGLDTSTIQENSEFSPFLSTLSKNKSFAAHIEKPSMRGYLNDLIILHDPVPIPAPPSNLIGIDQLLLSPDQLVQNNFPLVINPGYLETNSEGEHSGILGMDCEMVKTSQGFEIARISLVNFQGKVLYDKYVLPNGQIIDYLTRYSGITPEILATTALNFKDAQHEILAKINSEAVLCGHSLENDLNALKIIH